MSLHCTASHRIASRIFVKISAVFCWLHLRPVAVLASSFRFVSFFFFFFVSQLLYGVAVSITLVQHSVAYTVQPDSP